MSGLARWLPAALLLCALMLAPKSAALGSCKELQSSSKPAYTGCQILRQEKAALLWRTVKGSGVVFKLVVQVANEGDLGWMGFGFSDMGSMKGADILIVHRDDTGTGWAVTDTHATGFFKPVMDDSQDARLVSMEYDAAAGAWSAVVARKVKTCDLSDDFVVSARANFIVWAHGPASSPGFEGVAYHGADARGSMPRSLIGAKKRAARAAGRAAAAAEAAAELEPKMFYGRDSREPSEADLDAAVRALTNQLNDHKLGGPKCVGDACKGGAAAAPAAAIAGGSAAGGRARSALPPVVVNTDGSMTTDILCSSDIPEDETTYVTCYVEVPSDQDYHITSYTTLYGHRLVHHSLVYACGGERVLPLVEQLLNTTGPGPYNQKDHRQICEVFYMIGPLTTNPTYTFPAAAGLPMGASSYKYLAIEVHYNNPGHEAGQRDPGTGLRLTFEPKNPKKKDVGILSNGQYFLKIPPGKEFHAAGESVCHSKCTSKFTSDVVMFAQSVHMHGLGRSVVTRRVRSGVELEPLAWVRGFDYNYQTWISMPSPSVVLKRGDELRFTCQFDSRGRTGNTWYGFGTRDEMCFWWIYYYPAQPKISVCNSFSGTPLHTCMEDNQPLLDLYDAYTKGDESTVRSVVASMMVRGQAFLDAPQNVTRPFNASAGCAAAAPPTKAP